MEQTVNPLWKACRFCATTTCSTSTNARVSGRALQKRQSRENSFLPTKPQIGSLRITSNAPALSSTFSTATERFIHPPAIASPCRIAQYTSVSEYYSTLFHELTHSTGHVSRLNRLSKEANFVSEAYSKEELIAELGAAFLVNHAGLETDGSFHNSAGYIQSWLKALKDDKRLIVSAAGKADKAVAMILNSTEGITV
ncbi:MAG: hypothetical protein IKK75_14805 [Clostridia bacterium]|nr:hypothetical protein [Clostridia bacterium]